MHGESSSSRRHDYSCLPKISTVPPLTLCPPSRAKTNHKPTRPRPTKSSSLSEQKGPSLLMTNDCTLQLAALVARRQAHVLGHCIRTDDENIACDGEKSGAAAVETSRR